MRRHALLCFVTAVAFFTYSVCGLTMSYAAPKTAVVEVKPGTITGKVTDMDEAPLAGVSLKVLDSMGKVKHVATTGKDGTYSIEGLVAGSYSFVIADTQKVSLVVKPGSKNTLVNAMLPTSAEPYAAGDIASLGAPLIIAIAGGVIIVGVAIYGIVEYDSDVTTATSCSGGS